SSLRCSIQADRQALPSSSHAERPVQGSRRQEYWAADARGPRAEQASKLETRLLLSRSEGGTVARAGGNSCAPVSANAGSIVFAKTCDHGAKLLATAACSAAFLALGTASTTKISRWRIGS